MALDYPEIEIILGTASELGITHYRMGYMTYDLAKTVKESLAVHKRTMEKLEKVNRKFNIHGEYQNHSGTKVGGLVWDVYWILKDCDPIYYLYSCSGGAETGKANPDMSLDKISSYLKNDLKWLKAKFEQHKI